MDYPFYVNDFDRVKNHKENFPTVGEIFKYPQSFWYGEKNGKGGCPEHLTKSLNRLFILCLKILLLWKLSYFPRAFTKLQVGTCP